MAYCQPYSLQLHPWHLSSVADIASFEAKAKCLADDPLFVAVGECGLDALCDTPLPLQHEAFLSALRVAKALHRPVIVHCVRLWDAMMRDVKQIFTHEECLQLPVIVHGFRKGPQLAQQLLNAGFSISLGLHYNEATRAIIPAERLFFETDNNIENKT